MRIAREAGALTLEYFRSRDFDTERKSDGSDVTRADREAEAFLVEQIAAAHPEDAILGEEHGERAGTSGYRWVLDPIDGTKSFVHGVPLYGTLVAVEHEGVPVAGVIEMPALDERIYAETGGGAWHVTGESEPVAARVSSTASLSDALICMTAIDYFTMVDRTRDYEALAESAGFSRGWSDCYAHLLVATGRADAVVEPIVSRWDVAPMLPIITEAGGCYTCFAGTPDVGAGNAIASNGPVHEALRAIVNR